MGRTTPIQPPPAPLTDGAVTVRLRRASDMDAIAAASHDPQTRRWLEDGPMDTRAKLTGVARAEEAWRSGRAAPLVVADAATDEPVGVVNLQFRAEDVAALAYSVFPAHRGRGIAARAVRLVTAWAFRDLALSRLLLEADEANSASLRVAEKSGFHRLGTRTNPAPDGAAPRSTALFARTPAP
ncbi:Protein N-acetyltransferase, RimJ/RimL family [Actinacidiphila yanglinensis]|uniref:Protein N-acetyltransferase, RimJ/RimL family n=1 Tax=Actinacidiphila yanglinensis TaxID=310779 RepID=A0A1H6DWF6_9ACTN|nr:GNAT family protein [Actinacidiphila yanglinensis]SEG89667.1 Protein N-acetyltransferase, RimJ/RimL family [Actinacidiphila yanglinensis]